MATHSSVLAWRLSWTEEPGGLQSTGSQERLSFALATSNWSQESSVMQWRHAWPLASGNLSINPSSSISGCVILSKGSLPLAATSSEKWE